MPEKVGSSIAEDVVAMYQANFKPRDIAEQQLLSLPTVYNILHQAGVFSEKGRSSLSTDKQDAILNLWVTTSYAVTEIARMTESSVSATYNLIYASGIERPKELDRKTLKKLMYDAAIDRYLGGAKLWEIKRDFGIHPTQLYAEMHNRGVHPADLRAKRKIDYTLGTPTEGSASGGSDGQVEDPKGS